MYENEFKRILDASENNALTFFVGAGVSALSGAPDWKELIDSICDEMGIDKKEKYSSDDFLRIPQMYYYSIDQNKKKYHRLVKEKVMLKNLKTNRIHREMYNLNPVSFVTTNYDTLLEDASKEYCRSFKVVSCDKDVPEIFGDKYILKIHGDFKNNNIVLKEEDYLDYSYNFTLIETMAKSIFATNTVVLIGYSLNDYNIKLILNWTKTVLKDSYIKPIFVYTGTQALTREELIYQKSKGLVVIDCNNLTDTKNDYEVKYKSFFDEIAKLNAFSLEGKTEDQAFDLLYSLLEPLDYLRALRVSDVSKKLNREIRIGETGIIYANPQENLLIKKFFVINDLTEEEQQKIDKDDLKKYKIILSVFKKARINEVFHDHKWEGFVDNIIPFGDKNCILFDYSAMQSFCNKVYKTLEDNYTKAFYLSRLSNHKESFYLFLDIAKKAFDQKNYLLYYFAEANCISLRKIISNVAEWTGNSDDVEPIENLSPNDYETENLFNSLPVEFRNKYRSIKNIHNVQMLYEYSYKAFVDGRKLENAISSNSIEFGVTSSEKVAVRINDYLHFLLGNGIITDVFSEYQNTVKYLMSLLVYKYSIQEKKSLRETPFDNDSDRIKFDEIDFYCFINCFTDQELKKLFYKHHIKLIEFSDIAKIEAMTENLLAYYEYLERKADRMSVQFVSQIETLFMLLRYIDISQKLVDRVCIFFLTREFRNILISDKVLFLDAQILKRKKYSKVTEKVIEDTLIRYMDSQISNLIAGKSFGLRSRSSINYYNLVYYIKPIEEKYVSRRLSLRVSKIISNDISDMYNHITEYYCSYISKNLKNKIIKWAKEKIKEEFDFRLIELLVELNAKLDKKTIGLLKESLRSEIEQSKSTANDAIKIYPEPEKFSKLNSVGYLCYTNSLKSKDFKEFLGYSDVFDFYILYNKFDFSKFDPSWILGVNNKSLDRLASDEVVKEKIRQRIADELKKDSIIPSDYARLQDILIKHFC